MKRTIVVNTLALSLMLVMGSFAAQAMTRDNGFTNIVTVPRAETTVAMQPASMKKDTRWYSWLNPFHYFKRDKVQQADPVMPQEDENQQVLPN